MVFPEELLDHVKSNSLDKEGLNKKDSSLHFTKPWSLNKHGIENSCEDLTAKEWFI